MSVVDGERNAVSMTTTVNYYFGAHILSPSTGIVLNNEMDDFAIPANVSANQLPPAPANFIRPGKRPLSSMSPTIVLKVPFHSNFLQSQMNLNSKFHSLYKYVIIEDFRKTHPQNGQLKAVVGASGGGFIIAGTAEVLLNHFAKGMSPFSSVMAPRVYHQVRFII